jgi:hypothetical protein
MTGSPLHHAEKEHFEIPFGGAAAHTTPAAPCRTVILPISARKCSLHPLQMWHVVPPRITVYDTPLLCPKKESLFFDT